MKKMLFLGMLIMVTLLLSCGDDEPDCISDDYVGTYSGDILCPGNDPVSEIISITKISNTQISLSDNSGFVVLLEVSDCMATGSYMEDGDLFTVTINLDGSNLGFVLSGLNDDGDLVSCSGAFIK